MHPTNRVLDARQRARYSSGACLDRQLETAIVHFHFNAWAKYPDWQKDRRVPETAAQRLRKRVVRCATPEGRQFVLEGGGIEVNGRGTLITTEECYLSRKTQVRNPGLGRNGFETALREYLGVTNIFWLAGGVAGDDTHGHIDDLCRFVNGKTVVLIREENPEGRELPAAEGELGAHSGFPA